MVVEVEFLIKSMDTTRLQVAIAYSKIKVCNPFYEELTAVPEKQMAD